MYPARESDVRVLFKPIAECGEGGCHARIWLPAGGAAGEIDVVLMYHGGAFAVGTDSDVPAPEVDYLLSKGVVVVSAQYRLAPHVRFPEIVDDLCDAYAWVWSDLAKHVPGAERVRAVALEGWSAGAASCCLVGAHYAARGLPKPRAVFVHYGWFDMNASTLGGSLSPVPYSFEDLLKEPVSTGWALAKAAGNPPSNRVLWVRETMGKGELALKLFPEGSASPLPPTYNPVELVSPDFPPTFLLVATKDDLIPVEQSYDLIKRLESQGLEHGWAEADMAHGRSENTPIEERADYERWFEDAIRLGLDWTVERLRR